MRILRGVRNNARECAKVLFQPACYSCPVQPRYSTCSLMRCLHGVEKHNLDLLNKI